MNLKELSSHGNRMLQFLNDEIPAIGNEPRDLKRSELLYHYKENLANTDISVSGKDMEIDSGSIQWLFPLTTPDGNLKAPLLQAKDYRILGPDADVQEKMKEHFKLFLSFMGLSYNEKHGLIEKKNIGQWNSWLDNSENNERISRVLESMANFGLKQQAVQFMKFLKKEAALGEQTKDVDAHSFRLFDQETINCSRRIWEGKVKGTTREIL